MTTLIENAVALADIAKTMKTTVSRVEAEAHELSMFIGQDWAGRPAINVIEAATLVSGTARRDRDHDVAWRQHLADNESWESARERHRADAFAEAHDGALRRGRGAPAAASAGHEAARAAVRDFEGRTPPPEFNGKATATRWLTKTADKVGELI